ncbi:hypothetical protein [Sphaerisporangium perillae]|uniref:hypothetical protein n=1 Tax=Sphaerisporangium perillae TaxID=2935860 RepID=UPI00200F5B63|nr:hypothetical protein [Sphaerisporangium perillae]
MVEQLEREFTVRRAWPWLVLAVLASLVPWVRMAATESGGVDYIPLASFAAQFIGVGARSLFPLDIFVAGGLPLLVALAALCRRWWRSAGMAVAVILGAMAIVNMALFLDLPPDEVAAADLSAGTQPDFYLSTGNSGAAIPAIAYALAAIALVVGSRHAKVSARSASS